MRRRRRREKGEGRREKGEGRREKGEGRREKGEGRREWPAVGEKQLKEKGSSGNFGGARQRSRPS
jgi:hypothetical protein